MLYAAAWYGARVAALLLSFSSRIQLSWEVKRAANVVILPAYEISTRLSCEPRTRSRAALHGQSPTDA